MRSHYAALTFCLAVSATALAGEPSVRIEKTPHAGLQPQAITDGQGHLHLLYFAGDPRAGDLFYVRRDAGKHAFSPPIRVNSGAGSAIAVGTIRGGHLALGKNGRVHVAWNGSSKAEPKNPIAGQPMLYARMADDAKYFEPQRNLMTQSAILDGGGTLAADSLGNVCVAWHAQGRDNAKGEENRKVWVSVSNDDGKTFAAEKRAFDEPTGACGCCGMRGFADSRGNLLFLFRAASEKINRGMTLLHSADQGKTFRGLALDNWKILTCPMSSEAFAEGPKGVVAAWDNDGQIFFARIGDAADAKQPPQSAPGKGGDRKHPALAFNKDGEMLLAWTEGTGWMRGGALAWQRYDRQGKAIESGRRPGAVPVWGLPAVVAEPDGRFTILH